MSGKIEFKFLLLSKTTTHKKATMDITNVNPMDEDFDAAEKSQDVLSKHIEGLVEYFAATNTRKSKDVLRQLIRKTLDMVMCLL